MSLWYRYSQVSRWRWYAHHGTGVGVYTPGISAMTERGLRRKLAKWIREERSTDRTFREWRS